MRGRHEGGRRWMVALGAFALFAVFTLGVVHEYDHDVGHASESCAICATVRAPRATSPSVATLVCVVLSSIFLAAPVGESARPVARSTRSARGPPLG
ncbi:MAG: hypothetical protein P8R42_12805 [Candidatus Binatia bacterium]|nr:hypothetical protein [Candidatus Binatia bacterium]